MTLLLPDVAPPAATSHPMRIAIVSDTFTPQVNGVARTLARTANEMRLRGHDVRVYTPDDPRAEPQPDVVRFASRPFGPYPELRIATPASRELVARFQTWRPDVVHVATPFGMGLAARRAAKRLGIPIISSYHTSLATYARFYGLSIIARVGWLFLRWFHNGTSATLCPTPSIARELEARGFRNVGLWGRGVDSEQFNPAWRSEALRASWGAGPSSTVVAYVGRVAAEKGIDVMLAAIRQVALDGADIVFVIAGDGPYENEARRMAPNGTVFTGRIEGRALSETYASADVFLFASTTDTFGNVVQEAMASRLAIIAADVPQTRDVLGDAGLLVPAGSPSAFATAIRATAEQPAMLEHARQRAFEAAAERTWPAVFDGLEARYQDAIRTCRSARETSRQANSVSAGATIDG